MIRCPVCGSLEREGSLFCGMCKHVFGKAVFAPAAPGDLAWVPRDGRESAVLDETLRDKIRGTIRNNTTARHVPARIVQVPDLPRTINGKLVELAVREVVHGRPVKNLDALANPQALDYFKALPELQE